VSSKTWAVESLQTLNFESVITILGSIGLLIALFSLIRKKPRRATAGVEAPKAIAEESIPIQSSWWKALAKTRARFAFANSEINSLRLAMEEACITSDLGVGNTTEAMGQVNWDDLGSMPESKRQLAARQKLSGIIEDWVTPSESANQPTWPELKSKPTVIWFVGVNGVGKTTSIAKFAEELKSRGHSVLLAAGDTFRAAAGEQLETWAKRLEISCIKGQPGADSSSVLFDGIQSAKAKSIDFVLCDSAGRLHNQAQLMEALAKNKRVMDKALPGAPHECLLVLDANTGQNMLSQAEHFLSAVGVTGLVLTKLDGTARGGAVVAVARKTGLPIRRLGLGEGLKDFTPFDPRPFSEALVGLE